MEYLGYGVRGVLQEARNQGLQEHQQHLGV